MFASNAVFADVISSLAPAPAPTPKLVALPTSAVTMAALKLAIPEYFTAPSLTDAIASVKNKDQKWTLVARALTRFALIAAHSGTVSSDTADIAGTAKGIFKNQMLACANIVEGQKSSLKGSADSQAFTDLALTLEGQFLAIFEPAVKAAAVTKPVIDKIIAMIQGANLSADNIKAIEAALKNASKVEPALV